MFLPLLKFEPDSSQPTSLITRLHLGCDEATLDKYEKKSIERILVKKITMVMSSVLNGERRQ